MDNQNTSRSTSTLAVLAGVFLVVVGIGWLIYLATRTHEVASQDALRVTPTVESAAPSLLAAPEPTRVSEAVAPPVTAVAEAIPEATVESTSLFAGAPSYLADTDLGSGSIEFSAVTLNEALNRLMIADDGDRLFEFDLAADGTPISPPRRTLRVTAGAGDIEGIAWMYDTTYVLAHENDGQLTVVEIDEDSTGIAPEDVVRTIDTGVREVDGKGLEGVAYLGWADGAIEFVVVDERPATLLFLDSEGSVTSTVDLDLPDVADVWATSPESLLVVSDEGRAVVSLDLQPDGTVEVVDRVSLTLPDGRFEQPEGLTRDRAGTRSYVVGELPGAGQYSFGLWVLDPIAEDSE